MNQPATVFVVALFATVAACSGGSKKQDDHKVMKPEETVFRDYVAAPGKVETRVDQAMAEHRQAMEQRLQQDEGGGGSDASGQQDGQRQ